MNTKQRRVILIGFVVIVLMGLFPPWLRTNVDVHAQSAYAREEHDGYALVFMSRLVRHHSGGGHYRRVDCSLLLCQWFLVAAVTGLQVMSLADKPAREARSV